jgi:hypothetical protein
MAVPQSVTNLYEALLSGPSGQNQDACPFHVTHNSPDGKPEGDLGSTEEDAGGEHVVHDNDEVL